MCYLTEKKAKSSLWLTIGKKSTRGRESMTLFYFQHFNCIRNHYFYIYSNDTVIFNVLNVEDHCLAEGRDLTTDQAMSEVKLTQQDIEKSWTQQVTFADSAVKDVWISWVCKGSYMGKG